MSGIFGLFHRSGRPADPSFLQRMSDALSRRGPHAAGTKAEGPVGIGHRLLRVTPEAAEVPQPFVDDRRQLWITLDGRVDNPEELRKTLTVSGATLRTNSDAELLLAAYEIWGDDCPRHVLGDFAFAIWDARRRRLFCARDIVGVKPFVYKATPDRFAFASEMQVLVRMDAAPLRPNEGMVAEYLVDHIENREETLLQGFLRLPPAHTLVVTVDRIEKRRYWDIDPTHRIRYKTDTEYAEHFRQIFSEAVSCRLRNCASAGVLLSGGLDSSSVFAMARRASSTVQAFSLVFPGLECDESAFIRDLLEKERTTGHTAEPDQPGLDHDVEQVRHYFDLPDYPNQSAWNSLSRCAVAQKVSILLSGLGGDQWFSGLESRLARLLTMLALPHRAIRAAQRVARRVRSAKSDRLTVLTPAFITSTDLRDRLRPSAAPPGMADSYQEALYQHLSGGWEPHSLETVDRSSSSFGIEERHAFHDRRLIELAFAFPPEQHRRRRSGKFILREAMQGLLPESIRVRKTKADFSHLFPEAIERQGGTDLFSAMQIARAGWVSQEQVQGMYQKTVNLYKSRAPGYTQHIWPVAAIAGIELWFRTLFSGRDAPEPRLSGSRAEVGTERRA